jgi:hypothetical protein
MIKTKISESGCYSCGETPSFNLRFSRLPQSRSIQICYKCLYEVYLEANKIFIETENEDANREIEAIIGKE